MDYLSQLLGSTNEKVQLFVKNVTAFQNGESLTISKPPPPPPPPTTAVDDIMTPSADVSVTKPVKQKAEVVSVGVRNAPPPKESENQTNTTTKKTKQKDVITASKSSPTVQNETKTQDPPKKKESKPSKKSKPQKGKASFVCGCFGTKHKTLANCLV